MVRESSTMNGNYTYVGLDVDTTGRRLIDEIVNISAYAGPDSQYSQHIMPLNNLNPGARQRHQIRVINVGCFRMLKSMQTYKVIKTKTEIAALLEFLDWLDAVNKKDGIIFLYHDQQKFTPYMVIEAMKKYRLMDRFQKIVKSFVNGYDLVSKQGDHGIKYLTLAQNYKIQLEKLGMEVREPSGFDGDALYRAQITYDIIHLMAHGGEKKELEGEAMAALVNEFVRETARPISSELGEIVEQEESNKRQSTMRDIFRGYFQASRYHRRRAVTFRRVLAEASYDFESLEKMWNDGKQEGVAEKVKELKDLTDEDKEELTTILDSHFDPEKKAEKPIVQRRENPKGNGGGNMRRGNNRRRRGRSMNKENQDSRSNSRRARSVGSGSGKDRRRNNNNNNNNMLDSKGGAIRKDQQQVDSNQNTVLVAAN